MRTYFQCFFLSFIAFNAKLLHYLVKWHHQNDRNGHSGTFYIELRMKHMGVGFNLALLKESLFIDSRFLFFILQGIIIVHELKISF